MTKKTVIGVISDHPTIQGFAEEVHRLKEERDSKLAFIKKRMADIKKELDQKMEEASKEGLDLIDQCEDEMNVQIREVVKYFEHINKLGQYDRKKHCFHCDLEENSVYYHDADDHKTDKKESNVGGIKIIGAGPGELMSLLHTIFNKEE